MSQIQLNTLTYFDCSVFKKTNKQNRNKTTSEKSAWISFFLPEPSKYCTEAFTKVMLIFRVTK